MKDYFTPDGHLTDNALITLIYDEPDELSRLEIAEHLSFCDQCTARYAQLLTDDCLIEPPEEMADSIMQRIRNRIRMVFVNKYANVAIAASVTIVFLGLGVFSVKPDTAENMVRLNKQITQKTVQMTNGIGSFMENINTNLKGVFRDEK